MGRQHVVSIMDSALAAQALQRCSNRHYEIHRFLFDLVVRTALPTFIALNNHHFHKGDDNLQVFDGVRARLFRKDIVKYFADVSLNKSFAQMKSACLTVGPYLYSTLYHLHPLTR